MLRRITISGDVARLSDFRKHRSKLLKHSVKSVLILVLNYRQYLIESERKYSVSNRHGTT